LALRQFDAEGGAVAFVAGNGDGAVMIADHGLDNREAQAGALDFGGVVGREEAGAFFESEAFAGVGDFDADAAFVLGGAHG